ncbi:hypothetical protein [Shimia marina]|uniref:Uncharacterized protein n=1 Tax=Shimia marina TaxID=321267 RepID=A0A0P1EQ23_9RHOB|nr:hypothetical protein [Shimia marina]CUH52489.1 hypothetical protein SHM7688_01935 [Shimia marina]SFE13181.1 hypothetical protein SAMN04488037_105260 [Shimia marina]
MATKAELEAELADLRKQLDESRANAARSEDAETSSTEVNTEAPSSEDSQPWEDNLSDLLEELDQIPHKNALLLGLGIFAVGFLLGRSK